MKAHLRISTGQYEYIEANVDYKIESIDRVVDTYFALKDAYDRENKKRVSGIGIAQKEWNAALDRYLNDGTGETEQYVAMSPEQQRVLQEIKRAFKRIQAKLDK